MTVFTAEGIFSGTLPPLAVALGSFDGVHLGHRRLISKAKEFAERRGLKTAVWAFERPPKNVLLLSTPEEKKRLLLEAGADYVIFENFGAVRDLSAEDFVRRCLSCSLNAAFCVCGYNFRFGKNASGDAQTLSRLCTGYGIDVFVEPEFTVDGSPVSSSIIRELITNGKPDEAERLLGHPFSICGRVKHGARIGRSIGFPTLNISLPEGSVIPRFGVYASLCETPDGTYRAITNIGIKPTVSDDGSITCETHIPDFSGNLYGSTVRISLTGFIRPEKHFSSLDELKCAIASDIASACEKTDLINRN